MINPINPLSDTGIKPKTTCSVVLLSQFSFLSLSDLLNNISFDFSGPMYVGDSKNCEDIVNIGVKKNDNTHQNVGII